MTEPNQSPEDTLKDQMDYLEDGIAKLFQYKEGALALMTEEDRKMSLRMMQGLLDEILKLESQCYSPQDIMILLKCQIRGNLLFLTT